MSEHTAENDARAACGVTFSHDWHGYLDDDGRTRVCDGEPCTIPPGQCVCPSDICLGTDSDSGMRVECGACLALDPELPCLRDIPPGSGEGSPS